MNFVISSVSAVNTCIIRPKFSALLKTKSLEEQTHAEVLADFQMERGAKLEFFDTPAAENNLNTMQQVLDASIAKETKLTQGLLKVTHFPMHGE